MYRSAPVAQLDRAAASGAVGREFESLRAHQIPPYPCLQRSLSPLGISPAGSRFAHARKPAQVRISPGAPDSPLSLSTEIPLSARDFACRAPASLTPANRLKFESLRAHQIPPYPCLQRSLSPLGISPAGSRFAHARKPAQVRISPG